MCLYTAGRRPEGFDLRVGEPVCEPSRTSLGTYLAAAAQLEGASVVAFRRLRRELRAHGAPRRLLRSASRAARDERRHARRVGALARRCGEQAETPEVSQYGVRSLQELAIENAVEGCVRETFGALVATWQASHARDAGVRATMRDIARDETRHAALAWDVAQWAERRLPLAERERVTEARARALRDLKAQADIEPARELVEALGLPTAAQAARLIDAMVRALRVAQE
jgi:hypothetical protein